jgi:hypothetical protein
VARHFFSDPKLWSKVRPNITQALEKARKRANKEVMHLTYTRLDVKAADKPWPMGEIVQDIGAAFDAFVEHADLLPDDVKALKYQDVLSGDVPLTVENDVAATVDIVPTRPSQ